MKKLILLSCVLLCSNIALAERYPIKLVPAQQINTSYDEIETGDKIKFISKNDVLKNDKIYIKAGTQVIGIVDYIDENGWVADSAEILFKTFKTKNIYGQPITLKSEVTINGFEELKRKYPKYKRFGHYITAPIRGKEIEINPETDKSVYTIWLEY